MTVELSLRVSVRSESVTAPSEAEMVVTSPSVSAASAIESPMVVTSSSSRIVPIPISDPSSIVKDSVFSK